MTEQQQQQHETNQQALQAVSAFLYGLLQEEPDIDQDKAFYRAKDRFNGMRGLGKDQFFEIFDASKEQFSKPLVRASIDLAQLESDLRLRVSNALHEVEPTGPDHTRELIGLVRAVRTAQPGPEIEFAMRKAVDLVSDDLAAELRACWPKLTEEASAE